MHIHVILLITDVRQLCCYQGLMQCRLHCYQQLTYSRLAALLTTSDTHHVILLTTTDLQQLYCYQALTQCSLHCYQQLTYNSLYFQQKLINLSDIRSPAVLPGRHFLIRLSYNIPNKALRTSYHQLTKMGQPKLRLSSYKMCNG